MKKVMNYAFSVYWKKLKVLFLIMRLFSLLMLVGTLTVSAKSWSQQTKIDLQMQNSSVGDILLSIENGSRYLFIYDAGVINALDKKSIDVKEKNIEDVLDHLFKGTNVAYRINDRQVFLYEKDTLPSILFSEQGQISVKGRVTDSSGDPLPGLSVVLKGTTTGTITDFDGKYTLANVPGDATLVFSFVGMKSQEIAVAGKTTLNVSMEEESIGIEEVVAVGYGTVRKKDLTGAVTSVSGSALKDIPVTSAAQAIVGRMAGVQVTKTEGSPDAEIKIRVRGGGSITQDNSPLYIVDGFPVDNIDDVAPTDIESIDILKDASSTAIYGARGANGVVIITTKGGSVGKGKVSYNTYFGIKNLVEDKMLGVLDPYDYVLWQLQYLTGWSSLSSFERAFGDVRDIGLYKQMEGTNWQDVVFGRTGTSMYHNLALSGGSKTAKYNISLTNNDEKEVMIGSGYNRTNFTVKTSFKINNWLTVDLNSRLTDYHLKGAGTSNNSRLSHVIRYRPVKGLQDYIGEDELGEYAASHYSEYNPLNQTNDDYKRLENLNFVFNGAATIQFSKNLSYRFEIGRGYSESTTNIFYGVNNSNTYNYNKEPIATISETDTKSYRIANVVTYRKRDFLPGNNIMAMAGQELNSYQTQRISNKGYYFAKDIDAASALANMALAGLTEATKTSIAPDRNLSSFFGRVNYDYKGKYLASGTVRADGSSLFAPGHQWGYFPSGSVAWRMSDEDFMAFSDQWLTDLKVRLSYGQSGNNRISANAWAKTFSIQSTGMYMNGDGESASATPYLVVNSILSNPDLKWETTVTRNIGFDYSLFKQRLSGTIELYKNTTCDLLVQASVPASSGYSTQWQNIGQTSNKGLEISLNGFIVQKKDFQLSASFNIAFNRNHIDKLGEVKSWTQTSGATSSSGDYLIEEGGKVGLMYGYETEGMYSFDDFDYANGTYTLKEGVSSSFDAAGISTLGAGVPIGPGFVKFKDQDGSLVVDENDKVIIGDANPKHTGGFNLEAQFKGFDFSAFFNWVYGNDIYNANKLQFSTAPATPYQNLLDIMKNCFIYYDPSTGKLVKDPVELAELNKDATIWYPRMGTILHSWGVEDGSFLRLNTLTLGYSLPGSLLKKMKISKLRVYATAYNLWTWTNYSGYDPEVDCVRSTPLTPGIDKYAYPRSRSFNIGLNVEF